MMVSESRKKCHRSTQPTSARLLSLASASLAAVVVVEAALSLVPVTVLVATVLEVFHGLS